VAVTGRPIFGARPKGDHMVDYEKVTQDIREGLAKIAKEGKPMEIIMKEILAVLTMTCERHKLNKFDFIQAFYKWYKEKRIGNGF
jgi:hypothetical protein